MKFLDLSFDTPAENLAFDDALLSEADRPEDSLGSNPEGNSVANLNSEAQSPIFPQVLRVWRTERTCVVLGRGSRAGDEVHVDYAKQHDVPILRRFSGGASVVIGPGCLMYSLLIRLNTAPRLRMLDVAHGFVMQRMLGAIRELVPTAQFDGTCDLVIRGRKFSGNSLRVGRNWMLYHGTLLLNMQLSLIDQLLKHPPREPDYRRGRPHSEFVTNLGLDEESVILELRRVWEAGQTLASPPKDQMPRLISTRYGRDEWNFLGSSSADKHASTAASTVRTSDCSTTNPINRAIEFDHSG